jgi:hypothetical protein
VAKVGEVAGNPDSVVVSILDGDGVMLWLGARPRRS